MKQALYFFCLIILPFVGAAQLPDSIISKIDSSIITRDTLVHKADSSVLKKVDTAAAISFAQIVYKHQSLNLSGKPLGMQEKIRKLSPKDEIFYVLLAFAALLAFCRFSYPQYFNNLFRVLFNTSLRQGQLTDQLVQAQLPSLFFNTLSMLSGGLFTYFTLRYFNLFQAEAPLQFMLQCTLGLILIYGIKFLTLKFMGWVTGFSAVTDRYVFIVFLINKILGIFLFPLAVVMAFASPELTKMALVAASLLVVLLFLFRFIRSFGLLRQQIKISRLQFLLYLVGLELLPVLLIYKALLLLLTKKI